MRQQLGMNRTICLLCACLLGIAVESPAADTPGKAKPPHGLDMDYGPFISYSVLKPGAPTKTGAKKGDMSQPLPWKPGELIAGRGITVKLGNDAAVCFDADTMRYAAGWTGGWLDIAKSHLTSEKGSLPLIAKGTLAFTTEDGPGFAKAGSFKDPRANHEGPLPKDWAHFKGIYRDGAAAVFAYTVGGVNVLDEPALVGSENHRAFARTLHIDPSDRPLSMVICDANGDTADVTSSGTMMLSVVDGASTTCVAIAGGPAGARLTGDGYLVKLTIPPLAKATQFTIAVAHWPAADVKDFAALLPTLKPGNDLTAHTKGGDGLWKDSLETTGATGVEKDAYTVDTVAMPDQNPWHAWIRPTAFDFFKDGRVALCTWSGDVWIVSGLDDKLDHVQWKRFASGLYDPLGLRIVDDQIYVLARDGIVRLHDLNNDGEADFYENFNNDRPISAQYNGFAMELQTDSKANFYYTVSGVSLPAPMTTHSCLMKVSKDGSTCEVVASGLRAANGMAIGPHDEITVADNQGHWVPSSPIFMVKPGGFYGFQGNPALFTKPQLAEQLQKHPKPDPALCWIPYAWDNSSGGQVWAGDKWGPLSGHLMHTSYGKGTFFEVMPEQVDGVWQGAIMQMPLHFDSGIQRARVSPTDGQIWVCGLHGWQTAGSKDGCLQRVRYTGRPFNLPTELHVTDKGIHLTFAVVLDEESAKDEGSYGVEQWTYKWSETYGSPELKVSDPNVKGHDVLEVKSAKLSADKKSVLLEIPGIKPVMQYEIKMQLKSAAGAPIKCDIAGTINQLGREKQ